MLIHYCGPFAAVDVPELGVANLPRLEPVEVADDQAALLIESGAWGPAKAPAKPKTTTPASAPTPNEE